DTGAEGERLLNARWRVEVAEPADTVLAGVSGDPARQTFADLARAAAAASRVVRPRGRMILLTSGNPSLGPGAELLRPTEDAGKARQLLQGKKPTDMAAAFQWAHASQQAGIYFLAGLPAEVVEELNAVPLDDPGQVQRLLTPEGSCIVLPDAHKTLAVV